jgi:hypothetical protein
MGVAGQPGRRQYQLAQYQLAQYQFAQYEFAAETGAPPAWRR